MRVKIESCIGVHIDVYEKQKARLASCRLKIDESAGSTPLSISFNEDLNRVIRFCDKVLTFTAMPTSFEPFPRLDLEMESALERLSNDVKMFHMGRTSGKKDLTDNDKRAIVVGRQNGLTMMTLAGMFGVTEAGISEFLKLWKAQDGSTKSQCTGRPRNQSKTHRPCDQTGVFLNSPSPPSVSTVKRRLNVAGIMGIRPVKKPLISEKNRAGRVKWAKEHLNWTRQDWNKILWSDGTVLHHVSQWVIGISDDIWTQLVYEPTEFRHSRRGGTCLRRTTESCSSLDGSKISGFFTGRLPMIPAAFRRRFTVETDGGDGEFKKTSRLIAGAELRNARLCPAEHSCQRHHDQSILTTHNDGSFVVISQILFFRGLTATDIESYMMYNVETGRALLADKHVLFIGDSLIRGIYKDLILFLQNNELTTHEVLRKSNEVSTYGDRQIDIIPLELNKVFQQAREYQSDFHLIQYVFTSRAMRYDLEKLVLMIEKSGERPDIVVMNSALWDMTRYRYDREEDDEDCTYEEYLHRLSIFLRLMRTVLPPDAMFIWVTMPLISAPLKDRGFQFHGNQPWSREEFEYGRMKCLEGNYRAVQLVRNAGFDVLDLAFYFNQQAFFPMRTSDGVHWGNVACRFMTQMLLGHIVNAWELRVEIQKRYIAVDNESFKFLEDATAFYDLNFSKELPEDVFPPAESMQNNLRENFVDLLPDEKREKILKLVGMMRAALGLSRMIEDCENKYSYMSVFINQPNIRKEILQDCGLTHADLDKFRNELRSLLEELQMNTPQIVKKIHKRRHADEIDLTCVDSESVDDESENIDEEVEVFEIDVDEEEDDDDNMDIVDEEDDDDEEDHLDVVDEEDEYEDNMDVVEGNEDNMDVVDEKYGENVVDVDEEDDGIQFLYSLKGATKPQNPPTPTLPEDPVSSPKTSSDEDPEDLLASLDAEVTDAISPSETYDSDVAVVISDSEEEEEDEEVEDVETPQSV
ncbi:unnamed protein product [Caenorhabditis auriculariae]|uniref:Transposase Tc1-like domain-containing protein n=1 Tax=Caenorhabditis auriculariae TaxID=2777116 RepID=A0A8S1GR05_9PELO|nr:unnamed protein product [Caenorhabditis auriculariae]